jgi:dethiobiotin synthase
MKSVLVTGTEAGAGKTRVTQALARTMMASGRRVVAVKPVETGCSDATATEEDGARLAATTGQAEPRAALHRFAAVTDPAIATGDGGDPVDLDELILAIEAASAGADVLLIEGTGGLLTPITWEWTIVELARTFGADAVVVGVDRLGAINAVLLTLSALELAGIRVAGVALTTPGRPDDSTGLNAPAIARLAGLDRVVVVPADLDPAVPSDALAPIAGWLLAPPD